MVKNFAETEVDPQASSIACDSNPLMRLNSIIDSPEIPEE